MQGTSTSEPEGRQDWGDARTTFIAIRDEVTERRMRGHSLRRIYRDLKPPISYGSLTYHVRRTAEEDATEVVSAPRQSAADEETAPSETVAEDKLTRLRQLGEKAGHHGRRAVYDPSANSHEELFGPPKEK